MTTDPTDEYTHLPWSEMVKRLEERWFRHADRRALNALRRLEALDDD